MHRQLAFVAGATNESENGGGGDRALCQEVGAPALTFVEGVVLMFVLTRFALTGAHHRLLADIQEH